MKKGEGVKFAVTFLHDINSDNLITINSTSLIGTRVSTHQLRKQSRLGGTFEIYKGTSDADRSSTGPLDYNVSAYEFQQSLLQLYNAFSGVKVSCYNSSNEFQTKNWNITFPSALGDVELLSVNANGFVSYVGDIPSLESCCDSTSYNRRQTIFSSDLNDVTVSVTEKRKGSSETVMGHFELFINHFSSQFERSGLISVNSTEDEVEEI